MFQPAPLAYSVCWATERRRLRHNSTANCHFQVTVLPGTIQFLCNHKMRPTTRRGEQEVHSQLLLDVLQSTQPLPPSHPCRQSAQPCPPEGVHPRRRRSRATLRLPQTVLRANLLHTGAAAAVPSRAPPLKAQSSPRPPRPPAAADVARRPVGPRKRSARSLSARGSWSLMRAAWRRAVVCSRRMTRWTSTRRRGPAMRRSPQTLNSVSTSQATCSGTYLAHRAAAGGLDVARVCLLQGKTGHCL